MSHILKWTELSDCRVSQDRRHESPGFKVKLRKAVWDFPTKEEHTLCHSEMKQCSRKKHLAASVPGAATGNIRLPLSRADWGVETMWVQAGTWFLGQLKWKCCMKVIGKPVIWSMRPRLNTQRVMRLFLRKKEKGLLILQLSCCFWPSPWSCDLVHESDQRRRHDSMLPSSWLSLLSMYVLWKASSGGLHLIL